MFIEDLNSLGVAKDPKAPIFRPKQWSGDDGDPSDILWHWLSPFDDDDKEEFWMILATNDQFNQNDKLMRVTNADAVIEYGSILLVHVYIARQWYWVNACTGNLLALVDKIRHWALEYEVSTSPDPSKGIEKYRKFEGIYGSYANAKVSELSAKDLEALRRHTGQTFNRGGRIYNPPKTYERKVTYIDDVSQAHDVTPEEESHIIQVIRQKNQNEFMKIKHEVADDYSRINKASVPIIIDRLEQMAERYNFRKELQDQIAAAIQLFNHNRGSYLAHADVYAVYQAVVEALRSDEYSVKTEFVPDEQSFLEHVHADQNIHKWNEDHTIAIHDDSHQIDILEQKERRNIFNTAAKFDDMDFDDQIKFVKHCRNSLAFNENMMVAYNSFSVELSYRNVALPGFFSEDDLKAFMHKIIKKILKHKPLGVHQARMIAINHEFDQGFNDDEWDNDEEVEEPSKTPRQKIHAKPSDDEDYKDADPLPSSDMRPAAQKESEEESEDEQPAVPAARPQTGGKQPRKTVGKTCRKTVQTPSQLNRPATN